MEQLTKKTTILFSPALHERLARLARQRGTSLGDLVRAACEQQYGLFSEGDRLRAVDVLSSLALPVGDPATMKRESVPTRLMARDALHAAVAQEHGLQVICSYDKDFDLVDGRSRIEPPAV